MEMRTKLSSLRPGGYARILRTGGEDALSRRLLALGFVRGTRIYCERLSPFGGPALFRLRGSRVALRREECGRVLVDTEGET